MWLTLKATWQGARIHNITTVAAGVAFYGLFAIFPVLAAAVSIYGLVSSADFQTQLDSLSG